MTGKPKFHRWVVRNWDEFMRFVCRNGHGTEDVYTSVYALDLVIDKVFFEIDAPSMEKALEAACEFVRRLEEHGIPYIPVFSGRRGFHFYLLVKPWQPPNSETAKAILYDFSLQLTDGLEYVDPHTFGDIRQMARVPGTLHPKTGLYCCFLPPDFVRWNPRQVVEWARELKDVDYDISRLPDIRQLIDVDYVPMRRLRPAPDDFGRHSIPPQREAVLRMLRPLVRPCVWEAIQDAEPDHMVRTDFVAELLWLGYTEDEVVEIIKALGWADFDEETTRYHVRKIYEKRLLPLSCGKLKQYVRCTNCGWFYFWGAAREEPGFIPAPGRTREGSRPDSGEGAGGASSGEATVSRGKPAREEKFSLPRKRSGGWWFDAFAGLVPSE